MKTENIYGKKVLLREFNGPEELELIRLWRNSPENRRLFFSSHEITREEHLSWYSSLEHNEKRIVYAISKVESDQIVGYISAILSEDSKEVEFGIMLGEPDQRGKGFAEEAEKLIASYISSKYGTETGIMEVYVTNDRAIKFYEKQGYIESEIKIGAKMQDGKPCDVLVMKRSLKEEK